MIDLYSCKLFVAIEQRYSQMQSLLQLFHLSISKKHRVTKFLFIHILIFIYSFCFGKCYFWYVLGSILLRRTLG